ncbi:MAG: FlgD immunoglobulin-like domain containing protein [bacterium]
MQNPEIFQIDDPHTSFYWLIENRHFQDNDLNSYLPSAFPNYVNGQGLLVWRMDALDDDFPELIPADNDFHQVPNGTASQGDHGDFFPGANNNLLFAPTTIPSSAPSDDDVAFEVKSDNGTSFTVDFYNSNAPNPPPDAPKNLVITNVGQNGENPVLQWDANTEPDLDNYNIYRGYNDLETGQIIWNSVATATNTTWTDYDVTINTASQTTFRYKITAVDNASNESDYSNTVSRKGTWVPKQAVESSEDQAQNLPKQITLHQNYPNPFNPETEIRFELPEDARVVLNIYNILGEEVRSPVSGNMEMGFHSVSRDGKDKTGNDLPSGIYIYRFSVKPSNIAGKPFTAVKKLTLLC